jgi:predicted deacylase
MDEDPTPEVTVRGPEPAELAVVGGIHGDEPSGARAVRRLRESDLEFERGVKFVVANTAALAADERYLDSDLNRVFPGDPDGDREERLAAALCAELGDCPTLSLHATHSSPEPFALFDRAQPAALEVAEQLPVEYVVEKGAVTEGTLSSCTPAVALEAGCQQSEAAAETAERQARAFLQAAGAVAGTPAQTEKTYLSLYDAVEKPPGDGYELFVDNFEPVETGTVFASVDGDDLIAHRTFYPVLLSECGYENLFGYRAEKLGDTLEKATVALDPDAARVE